MGFGVNWRVRVSSNGGRYAFKDDWETPDTQTISWDFPEEKRYAGKAIVAETFLWKGVRAA